MFLKKVFIKKNIYKKKTINIFIYLILSDDFALNNQIQFGNDKAEDDVITAKPIRKNKKYIKQ